MSRYEMPGGFQDEILVSEIRDRFDEMYSIPEPMSVDQGPCVEYVSDRDVTRVPVTQLDGTVAYYEVDGNATGRPSTPPINSLPLPNSGHMFEEEIPRPEMYAADEEYRYSRRFDSEPSYDWGDRIKASGDIPKISRVMHENVHPLPRSGLNVIIDARYRNVSLSGTLTSQQELGERQ